MRPVAEYAAPLWHSGLTDCENHKIELLQKHALAIILGTVYVDFRKHYKVGEDIVPYNEALQAIGLTTLNDRREVLTRKFAFDLVKSQKYSDLFEINHNNYMATRNRLYYKEPRYHTDRYFKSAIPYMTRLLNKEYLTSKKPL